MDNRDEFRSDVIQVLRETNYGKDGLLILQVVQWYKNGRKVGTPKLVNQEHYMDKAGVRRPGKNKGLSAEDVRFITGHSEIIVQAIETGLATQITNEAF